MIPTQSQNELRLPFIQDDELYVYDLIDISNNESRIQENNLFKIDSKTNTPVNSESSFHKDTLEGHHNSIVDFLSFNK
jgi:hypothetical protein